MLGEGGSDGVQGSAALMELSSSFGEGASSGLVGLEGVGVRRILGGGSIHRLLEGVFFLNN